MTPPSGTNALPTLAAASGPPAIPPLLVSLRAVAYAVMTPEGRLVAANEGFHYLMRRPEQEVTNIAPHIVNPPFDEIVNKRVEEGTVLHRGHITFLDADGQSRSLVGIIYRHGDHIELVAEHDVAEQERLFATIMQLNDELAEQQRETVRTNRELIRQRDALDAEVACRKVIEAEQAALLEKLTAAQNQLLQAEKMASIGQLAAGVAHEINNPIGFVSSNLTSLGEYFDDLVSIVDTYARADSMIAREPSLSAAIRQAREDCDFDFVREDGATLLAESREGLARVTRIVQDLKSYSRVDESVWQETDINACLDSTLNVARHELKDRAQVVREYDNLPLIRCCPGQLNQVFMNLIINAAQAMDKPGRITVRSGQLGDWVWADVEDTGNGIAPENVKRIFEPFFTTKPVGQGTGLGLSLSWNIVKTHGGRIDVDSQLHRGTRFRVWLPMRSTHADDAPPLQPLSMDWSP